LLHKKVLKDAAIHHTSQLDHWIYFYYQCKEAEYKQFACQFVSSSLTNDNSAPIQLAVNKCHEFSNSLARAHCDTATLVSNTSEVH
jgi:hypothetical protein